MIDKPERHVFMIVIEKGVLTSVSMPTPITQLARNVELRYEASGRRSLTIILIENVVTEAQGRCHSSRSTDYDFHRITFCDWTSTLQSSSC